MCENIKVVCGGSDYEEAVITAMVKVKDALPEDHFVYRDPEQCKTSDDWFLAHSECELSPGETQVGGAFTFRRNYEEGHT